MRFVMITLALVAALSCGGIGAKLTCETDDDCLDGYGCDSGAAADERICLRQCAASTDCLALQSCDTSVSLCRQCASGEQPCGGVCVNIETDSANCGDCGITCAATAVCSTGQCLCGGAGGDACTAEQGDGCTGTNCECGGGAECVLPQTCNAGACS